MDRFWDDLLYVHPVFATFVGDERFDDRLPDPSPGGLARQESVARSLLRALSGLAGGVTGPEARRAAAMAEAVARRDLAFVEHRLDRLWAVSHMFGGHLFGPPSLLGHLGELQRADTSDRLERYLRRLAAVPHYLEAAEGVTREAVDAGQVAPAVVVDRSIASVERMLEAGPEACPAMGPVERAGPEAKGRVGEALGDRVFPGFARYLEALRDYRRSARPSVGLRELPEGDVLYAAEVLGWTTMPLAAGDLHETGREELDAVREEAGRIARGLGHRDPLVAAAAAPEGQIAREEVLRMALDQVDRGWEEAVGFFGRLPERNCEVRPIPEEREGDGLDYYQGPSADWSRPGVFWVNTAPRARHSLAPTTFHEATPGHHFEQALALSDAERHPIRRHGGELQGAAFTEGWGLYAERLADEMGLYRDDWERLGMLELQALRAARLMVDTGLHAFGWSRRRAVETLEETGLPRWNAEAEADRYIAMPGQALCYKVGQLEIERWRAEASRRPGFRLSDFHDRLLAVGSLPLPALGREVGVRPVP